MNINVTYKPVLQFTTKFCRQKFRKVIRKEEILFAVDADIFFLCSTSHGMHREKIL